MLFTAALVPEPTNPYDRMLSRYTQGGGHVGCFSRDDAAGISACDTVARSAACGRLVPRKVVGGTSDKPNIGVVLDLKDMRELVACLAVDQQPF